MLLISVCVHDICREAEDKADARGRLPMCSVRPRPLGPLGRHFPWPLWSRAWCLALEMRQNHQFLAGFRLVLGSSSLGELLKPHCFAASFSCLGRGCWVTSTTSPAAAASAGRRSFTSCSRLASAPRKGSKTPAFAVFCHDFQAFGWKKRWP